MPRGSIRAKALVTRRVRPLQLKDRLLHTVGLPMHWGYDGLAKGAIGTTLARARRRLVDAYHDMEGANKHVAR